MVYDPENPSPLQSSEKPETLIYATPISDTEFAQLLRDTGMPEEQISAAVRRTTQEGRRAWVSDKEPGNTVAGVPDTELKEGEV